MMEQMKPSGIDWIGEIPTDWNIKRVKYLASLKGRIGWQGLTSDEYIDEGPFLITGIDFCNGGIDWENCVHITEERWAEAPEIHIHNGDLLITKDGTIGKVAIVDNLTTKASLNSGVLLIRPQADYDKKFLFWVLQSDEFWTWFKLKNAGNSTIVHLYQGDFAEFSYTFPNITEQHTIADFLDDQCAKIDSVITDIEKQIETLQKYRNSLITEAVTKGLDRSVPMKDSGIEWIGMIPKHWIFSPLKYLFNIGLGLTHTPQYTDSGVPFISVKDISSGYLDTSDYKYISYAEYKQFPEGAKPHKGDILFGRVGTLGTPVILEEEIKLGMFVSVGKLTNIAVQQIQTEYMKYWMLSSLFYNEVYQFVSGSAQINLNTTWLKQFNVLLPSLREQKEIVDYLDEKCSKIDAVIAHKKAQRETLVGYKNSLIFEYVTGKKRVTEMK